MSYYLVVAIIVLVALLAVAFSIISQARSAAVGEISPEDELAEFQRMRETGEISEEEYQKMKKIIAEETVRRAKGE